MEIAARSITNFLRHIITLLGHLLLIDAVVILGVYVAFHTH